MHDYGSVRDAMSVAKDMTIHPSVANDLGDSDVILTFDAIVDIEKFG